MSKVITYLCDCCVIVYPLDELEGVQVYVFGNPNASDPKLLDYEQVCPNCREELLGLMNKWLGTKKNKPMHKSEDKEVRIETKVG